MAMAHSKTQTGGGGSHARQVDAPSLEKLDELIAKHRAEKPDISGLISTACLSKKLNIANQQLWRYMKKHGYHTTKLLSPSHVYTNYISLEDAARLVEQRAKEGLL